MYQVSSPMKWNCFLIAKIDSLRRWYITFFLESNDILPPLQDISRFRDKNLFQNISCFRKPMKH